MTSTDTPAGTLTAVRALLALTVVFIMLATTGWTTLHQSGREPSARVAALALWARGTVDGRRLPTAETPAPGIRAFFATLDGAQRARLADRYPLVVGNLDGAPVTLRYRANRRAMVQARAAERARAKDYRLAPAGRDEASRRAHRLDSLLTPDRRILAFDPAGGGRVAEVFGDLDTARRVSVVVPGVDTDLLTFERTQRRYSAPVGMSEALYEAERAADPASRTAVIAWADYTTPTGVGMDAATGRLAADGAVRLRSMVAGLPGNSRVELFCHSYGSVVCGVAAHGLPARVTDIAVAGSPGMRSQSAAGLGTTARVWAMRDPGDWIGDVPYLELGGLGHGADPVSRGFGARVLSSAGAQGHTGYFTPGTVALANLARIGVGSYASVVCRTGGSACSEPVDGTDGA
ncbi:alpha/beta hydrolase [Streptomyces sp. NRRL S-87]|uniref:alpha/beta hydrolase n=1 Tax=Streptomyces sp. NRRL S-87 TaxID=1463920 RepID=UPI0004C05ADE|nr:alpha/beta hydrolase [Streptomyces sp. NRRL S-87]